LLYDRGMVIPYELIGGCWILFWLYWLISAIGAKKNARPNIRRFAGIRIGIFILALVLVHVSIIKGHAIGGTYFAHNNGILAGIGFVLLLSGLSFAIWARVHLGKNWGMPMTLKQDPELVTSGPYRFVRHPIYSGILLAVLGSALTGGLYWLIILVVLSVYFVYSAYEEEKIMLRQFPTTYPAYKDKTKMLIPFVL
jgi:protein-S-isoprenylcysteine O-methyltransferase Ste14